MEVKRLNNHNKAIRAGQSQRDNHNRSDRHFRLPITPSCPISNPFHIDPELALNPRIQILGIE